jgi:uncharacterized protein with NAD-binding domain and iron-sulfur cluster
VTKTVVILGGGVAGMSAAHELIERGFAVQVYELKTIPGGKARSLPVPNSGTDGRKDLPSEHGFRFFPRFYKHIVDTLHRIPYGQNQTVADNLVETTRIAMARFDQPPLIMDARCPRSLADCKVVIHELFSTDVGLSTEDKEFFGEKIWQIITSCEERRMSEYERLGWWDFIGAEARSAAYQKFLGHGLTRTLVAAQAQLASTKTIGDIFVQLLFDLGEPGVSSDRLLNGPTNEVWIQPWLDYLTQRGVAYHFGVMVKAINCSGGVITGVTVEENGAAVDVTGDYYIAALPVEVIAPLITPSMLEADPTLAIITQLSQNVQWMNGTQFYLTGDVPIIHGHQNYIDSPWALTGISQHSFWPHTDLSQYGDGTVTGILSVDISDWDTPGLNGKTAKECTRDELRAEVWAQLKRSLNVNGQEVLRDDDVHTWYLDPDIVFFEDPNDPSPARKDNREPLLVNLVNTWHLRPDAFTAIPNLFLASDYVRTNTDLATMEGANEAARRAVNCIIHDSGVAASFCGIWKLHEPALFAPWRAHDLARYQRGLPWDGRLL